MNDSEIYSIKRENRKTALEFALSKCVNTYSNIRGYSEVEELLKDAKVIEEYLNADLKTS